MSFVYNDKLPFHIWGVDNAQESYGLRDDDFIAYGRLTVPIPESGAPRVYRFTPFGVTASSTISSFAAQFEDTPCDAQLPLADVIAQPFSSYVSGLALTLHGELYQFPAYRLPWLIGNPSSSVVQGYRRLSRICAADVQEPFARLCFSDPIQKNGVTYGPVAITKSGRVFRVAHFAGVFSSGKWNDRPLLDEITTPTSAEWYYQRIGTIEVVTTTEPRTYIRRTSASPWSTLTTGCHLLQVTGLLNAQFRSATPPVATVDAPPSGETATVAIEWAGAGTVNNPYTINLIRISNPGSGYTTDPTVTFSVAPSSGTANIKLKVFSGTLRKAFNIGTLFMSDDNKLWALEAPAAGAVSASSFPLRWATEYKTTTTTKNANATYDKPLAAVTWSESKNTRSTVFWENIIDNSGGLFELKELGEVTGASIDDYNPELVAKFDKVSDGPWRSICVGGDTRQGPVVFCGVKTDNTMWTWGKNGESTSRLQYALFADGSDLLTSRTTPVQIASQAEWLQVFDVGQACFLGVRKDAICREINQPMEYWPDWHYETQT